MLDVAVAYNRFKFLGHEFLTWLFFALDTHENNLFEKLDKNVSIEIGNRLTLENRKAQTVESVVISGENAGLEEAFVSLAKGSFITEINLNLKTDSIKSQFNLKGESLTLSSLKFSEPNIMEKSQDLEAGVLEKIYILEMIFNIIDTAFKCFIETRISDKWKTEMKKIFSGWVYEKNSLIGRKL